MRINYPGGLSLDFHVDSFGKGKYWKESAKEDRITIALKEIDIEDDSQNEVTLYLTVSDAIKLSLKLNNLAVNEGDPQPVEVCLGCGRKTGGDGYQCDCPAGTGMVKAGAKREG